MIFGTGSHPVGVTQADVYGERRRRQFATLLEHSPDGIVIVDVEGRICEWNPAAEELSGRARVDVIDTLLAAVVPPALRSGFDALWARLLAGAPAPAPLAVSLTRDGIRVGVTVHVASITANGKFAGAVLILRGGLERGVLGRSGPQAVADTALDAGSGDDLAIDEVVTRLGVLERDDLTGLPGRRRLQRRLADPVPPGLERGVAVLDLDAFAMVNESLGPDAGDLVLAEFGRRLREGTAAAGLGRWQADSFMWVLDCVDPRTALDALSLQVADAVRRPFEVGGGVHLTVSMGLVTSRLAPERDLVAAAMDALRAAKESGRDRAVWYDRNTKPSSASGLRMASDLHRGIANEELRLHYQPIMDLASNDIVGIEALVRWERPGVGLLNPTSFIDVAERTGQIVQLGNWVTRHACRAAASLAPGPGGPRTVSINVSARQLSDPGLVEMLTGALRDSGCPPSSLVVEVTETALMYDLALAVASLDTIKELGVGLDLDDFGTGYSSLLYLKHFPVDRIKIDQSFVAGLGSNWADTAIVASTIALAHSIGILAVAEGVETPEQLAQLRTMGCDFAQGFLLSRPLPLDVLTAWLRDRVPAAPEDAAAQDLEAAQRPASSERSDAADHRDEVADTRDELADQRDAAADARDQSGNERDELADLRDELADARDVSANRRTEKGPDNEPSGIEHRPRKHVLPHDPEDGRRQEKELGSGAESSRTNASQDRHTSEGDRQQAERERDTADQSREARARERREAELGRAVDGALGLPELE
ncbi:EAL domain-containing protein [Pengzhenrongella phosphoraccumulans]|uniref:EAL domain-containing protein n=1 Tax=Pengzhenrongella phosphoraccumulans TaxID=3114394 RepID=UPI003890BEBD